MSGFEWPRLGFALCLGLAACGQARPIPSGLNADLQQRLRFCDQMRRDVTDWCAYEMLENAGFVDGDGIYEVCETMSDVSARDACLELFSRTNNGASTPGLCHQITNERLRGSCALTVAETVMRNNGDIAATVAACKEAGQDEVHCVGHIPGQRLEQWRQSGGRSLMEGDLREILTGVPEAANFSELGQSTAIAALNMGMSSADTSICDNFPDGIAKRSCKETMGAGSDPTGASSRPMPQGNPNGP